MKNLVLLSVFIFLTFNVLGQNDAQAPVVQCRASVETKILPVGNVSIPTSDVLSYAKDNVTPVKELVFGIREKGTGAGFPVDAKGEPIRLLSYDCKALGKYEVELWAKDKAGNAAFCATTVSVSDPSSYCAFGTKIFACAQNHCGGEIDSMVYLLDATSFSFPIFKSALIYKGSCAGYKNNIPVNNNYLLIPTQNKAHSKGVTTYDLVQIAQHILGLKPINSPYLLIAADADSSNSVTPLDVAILRDLIMGKITKLPNNQSWRFVQKNYVFPNPNDPFVEPIPENIHFDSLLGNPKITYFIGIKIGDINCSTQSKFTGGNSEDRSAPLPFSLPDLSLSAGETLDVPIFLGENGTWSGLQFELAFDPQLLDIQLLTSSTLSNFSSDNYHISDEGVLRVSWSEAAATTDKSGAVLNLRLRARAPLRLRDAITLHDDAFPSEVYSAEAIHPLQLHFRPSDIGPIAIGQPWPNPATEGFNIDLNTTEPTTYHLQIVDPSGRVLYRASEIAPAGESLLQVPAHALPSAGVYGWWLSAGNILKSGTFVLAPKP